MLRCLRDLTDFQYIPCCKQNHEAQPMSLVCVDLQCDCRNLLCVHCEQQSHQNHKTMPVKDYLRKIMQETYQQIIEATNSAKKEREQSESIIADQESPQKTTKNIISYCQEADTFRQEFFEELQNFRTQINQCIDQIKVSSFLYINQLNTKIRDISGLMKQVQNIIQESKQYSQKQKTDRVVQIYSKKCQKRIKSILKYGFMTEDEEIPIKEQLDNILADSENRKFELKKLLNSGFKNLKNNQLTVIKDLLTPYIDTYQTLTDFCWSTKFKAEPMKINGNIIERTGSQYQIQRFALMDKSLQPFVLKRKCVSWTLKITKLVGWIGVGVCLKNKIVNSNYQFNYQSLGHGSYLISTNGYSWSSTVQGLNSSHQSLGFSTGDHIFCEFDPVAWKIRFQIHGKSYNYPKKSKSKVPIKKSPIKNFQLDLEDMKGTDQYYPCVNLCSNGDSVQIINE